MKLLPTVWNDITGKFESALTIDRIELGSEITNGHELLFSDGGVFNEFLGDQDEVITTNFCSIFIPTGVGQATFTTPASMAFQMSF